MYSIVLTKSQKGNEPLKQKIGTVALATSVVTDPPFS
jgi:hypothetical protein